jgi:glycerophosphoryl diester phosphodiesterase
MTSTDISLLDASGTLLSFQGPPQYVPTLEQVLRMFSETEFVNTTLQIEIKTESDGTRYHGLEETLIELLLRYKMTDRVSVISFDFDTLARIRQLQPSIPLGALVGKAWMSSSRTFNAADTAALLGKLDVEFIGVSKDWLSPALVSALHREHLEVGVWTVDDPGHMQRFITMGVEFITTNRPDLLESLRH